MPIGTGVRVERATAAIAASAGKGCIVSVAMRIERTARRKHYIRYVRQQSGKEAHLPSLIMSN
jgi:hypothetical protein